MDLFLQHYLYYYCGCITKLICICTNLWWIYSLQLCSLSATL